jgi:hypothetical protein
MFPLGRGPDWTGALDDAVLKTVATEVENLIAELEALAQVAGQVQAEQNAIAGPPLEEAHLEEMAQQLTTQPAAGLEALDRSDEAPDTVEVLKAEEAKLRLELDRHTQFLSLAIGLAVLTVAAGVVVLLGGNTELGLAFLIVGPLACGGWAASISSVRSRTKREISEIVRRRVFESNRMKSASAEKAGPAERSEYSKLPAVAERVRALQQARKETAQKRLKVRAEHATWTKKFLEVHEVVRKRLGSPPDIFSSANVKAWLQESRQILDTLEAETVRRERNAQLVADRRNRDAALAQFALARKALTTALGSEADALSNEELEEHAGKLLADCSEILAVESALERAVEIPEAPLVERLAAVESRIQSLEALIGHGEDGTTLSLDPETLSELDRVRLSDARQRAEEATTDHDRLQAALDHVTFAIQQRSIALEYLVGAVREACEQFRDRISGLFADFVEHLWRDGHLGSDAPHECPSLDESLRVSGPVPDHLRSAVELLRQTALAVQCSGPIRLVYPEPLADADNPTYLAWMSALSSHAPAAGVTSITILTCQPWRVDALRSLAPDLFLSIPVRRLDE